jgi:hypothetical protein
MLSLFIVHKHANSRGRMAYFVFGIIESLNQCTYHLETIYRHLCDTPPSDNRPQVVIHII